MKISGELWILLIVSVSTTSGCVAVADPKANNRYGLDLLSESLTFCDSMRCLSAGGRVVTQATQASRLSVVHDAFGTAMTELAGRTTQVMVPTVWLSVAWNLMNRKQDTQHWRF